MVFHVFTSENPFILQHSDKIFLFYFRGHYKKFNGDEIILTATTGNVENVFCGSL